MKWLIACEESGTVRDAFLRAGHYAISCDLLPSLSSYGDHYQGNVLDILGLGWDGMIAHPSCTYLSSSGLHWNRNPKSPRYGGGKRRKRSNLCVGSWPRRSNTRLSKIRSGVSVLASGRQRKSSSPMSMASTPAKPLAYGLKTCRRWSRIRASECRAVGCSIGASRSSVGPIKPTPGKIVSGHRPTAGKSGAKPTRASLTLLLNIGAELFIDGLVSID